MLPERSWKEARKRAAADGWNPSAIENAQDVRAVEAGCRFDARSGQKVVDFFGKFLRHSKDPWVGRPFLLLPWQEQAVRRLYGWRRPDGTRRFRRGGIWVPKKNGKSTLISGLELYHLMADGLSNARVYTAAVDRGQAGIIHDEVASMVRQSPDLKSRLQVIDSRKTITYPGMAGRILVLSADVNNREGINASALFKDELHVWEDRRQWDVLAYATASSFNAMDLSISTAGIYDETAIGWEQYDYARKVASDQIEDWAFFSLIFEASAEDDWTDPAVWRKANPSFGVTMDPEIFAEECREAQQSPAKQNAFRRYRLNQWVRQVTRAIDLAVWDENAGHDEPFRVEDFAGRSGVVAGLDLASVSDLTAIVYGAECEDAPDHVDIAMRCWVPEAQLSNQRNPNRELYQQWKAHGWLETTPGDAIDYDFIEAAIVGDSGTFQLRELNIDALFQGQGVANHLQAANLTIFKMGQGYRGQGPAMKELHRRLLLRGLHHGGHPILRWCADNTETASDPEGNERIVKPKANSSKKVDPMRALVMMLDRVSRSDGVGESAYADGHGLVIA